MFYAYAAFLLVIALITNKVATVRTANSGNTIIQLVMNPATMYATKEIPATVSA